MLRTSPTKMRLAFSFISYQGCPYSLLRLSYPFFPGTTPYAPPSFPNIVLRSRASSSGFSVAKKCPPESLSDSNTTSPRVLHHVFGRTESSFGLYAIHKSVQGTPNEQVLLKPTESQLHLRNILMGLLPRKSLRSRHHVHNLIINAMSRPRSSSTKLIN